MILLRIVLNKILQVCLISNSSSTYVNLPSYVLPIYPDIVPPRYKFLGGIVLFFHCLSDRDIQENGPDESLNNGA